MIEFYASQGWSIVPIPPGKKAPVDTAWIDRTYAPHDIPPGHNVGVKLGAHSRALVDIDLDSPEAIALAPRFLPPTATFGRASKPRSHWLYRCVTKTRRPARTTCELRSTGCQTVFPGSFHETGEAIEWSPDTVPPVELDEQALCTAFGKLALATTVALAWPSLAGNRHDFVMSLCGALWRDGWTHDDVRVVFESVLDVVGEPDAGTRLDDVDSAFVDSDDDSRTRWGWPTVDRIAGAWASAMKAAAKIVPTTPRGMVEHGDEHALTDAGNAERFIADHAHDVRYARGIGWLVWDGTRWRSDDEPMTRALASMRALGQRTSDAIVAKWAVASEARARLDATLSLASRMPALVVEPTQLDADPWRLCVANGEIDLRTGVLEPHRRESLITKLAPVAWDPSATCPRFSSFLSEVFAGDHELALYVLRFLGYGLTGVIREHALGLWHGPQGRNGKGTLLNTVTRLMGDYADTLAPHVVIGDRSQHPTSLMTLLGKRLIVTQEVDDGRQWNEAIVKTLTGGNPIRAHYMRQDEVTFMPTHKLVVAVNARPRVVGQGSSFWTRVHLVPWLVSFAGREQLDLEDALASELPGILRLLVLGCLQWQRIGLAPPHVSRSHADEYRRSQDTIGAFLAGHVREGPGVAESELYARYRFWATSRGEYVLPASAFLRVLGERGLSCDRLAMR